MKNNYTMYGIGNNNGKFLEILHPFQHNTIMEIDEPTIFRINEKQVTRDIEFMRESGYEYAHIVEYEIKVVSRKY